MATSSFARTVVILIISGVLAIASSSDTQGSTTNDVQRVPQNFLLGASASSYQIEGAWNEDGKGLNVCDQWTHQYRDKIYNHSNGDVACDFYHKYKEDVQTLKNIGVDFFRFSLSWSRILPNGYSNVINHDGLKFYKDLIDELIANDIEPFVTLYHWDHPNVFEDMGGWTNELMVEWISEYARVVFKELGPKVKYFTPINEPTILCNLGYGSDLLSPGKKLNGTGPLQCIHNTLKAHARIYHIYDKEFRKEQNGQIGPNIPCNGLFAKTTEDVAAVDTYFQFSCGIIAAPIFSKTGDYPEIVKNHMAENSRLEGFSKSILPEFSPEWVQYIKGTADFFGLNHYTSNLVEIVPRVAGEEWYDYSGVKTSVDPSWPSAGSKWLKVVPSGFRQVLNQITTEYDHPPIYIMENGVSDNDGNINDYKRISYLHSYMDEMLSAIYKDGCNIKGYSVWSLLDSFEWSRGYSEKFGMVQVNFMDPNRTRTPKSSSTWYKNVIKTREILRIQNSIISNLSVVYI
ncbi:PREDICTED: myrosinase 1-like [Dinoponera quadriceps]|uniref:beta-glucosidase n=1 Tax=Dinoponera quadriceps TaxID=609295 RepID=A0A6P3XV09_DINQU|nr:PREDICTED: myrosinase 1-like [Dinoponera quadriceps]XP_014482385.1 PREDICTED: myrosinase 1-like [Dinoponera quadriceps]